jgi:hypothetical protein
MQFVQLHRKVRKPILQFRAEGFNTFTQPQFLLVDPGYTDAIFGQVTAVQDLTDRKPSHMLLHRSHLGSRRM